LWRLAQLVESQLIYELETAGERPYAVMPARSAGRAGGVHILVAKGVPKLGM